MRDRESAKETEHIAILDDENLLRGELAGVGRRRTLGMERLAAAGPVQQFPARGAVQDPIPHLR